MLLHTPLPFMTLNCNYLFAGRQRTRGWWRLGQPLISPPLVFRLINACCIKMELCAFEQKRGLCELYLTETVGKP